MQEAVWEDIDGLLPLCLCWSDKVRLPRYVCMRWNEGDEPGRGDERYEIFALCKKPECIAGKIRSVHQALPLGGMDRVLSTHQAELMRGA